ncbi:ankyrin [Eremomyces bilateralis CBS 781.70]|uniref:Ankyrin n=1 Tax=Eremomyces bilateralis CBS 781.70 TaxID=1392243 RepID=A0A6G1FWJ6_9PEZI|nr:ankyrin [Eremomyces bilateralis CBS 781.70]KAF1810144.1 ankyrin [Eremomyces bilateralis CBS 781.70]
MADPFSLVASLIALDANFDSQAAQIEDLKVVLRTVKRIAKDASIDADDDAILRFQQLFIREKEAVEETNDLVKPRLVKNPESLGEARLTTKVRKIKFLREEKHLEELNARLSDIIQGFSTALQCITALELLSLRVTHGALQFGITQLIESDRVTDQGESSRVHEIPDTSDTLSVLDDESTVENTANETLARVEVMITEEELLNLCSCSCHTYYAAKVPNWLGDAIGTLLAAWNAAQQLSVSLSTTRMIPEGSSIFQFAQHNNVDGVRRLFIQRTASPFDISINGRTPLHFAATAVKADMIKFLLDAGGIPDAEDSNHLTPHDIIWELYLRNPKERGYILEAAGLSPSDTSTSLEKQQFTGVHRIVLGLRGLVDLDDYLKLSATEIDKQDLTGKTALAWAASRKGDSRLVRILLDHNASVRIADYRYKTPLHYAAKSEDPNSVALILEAIKQIERMVTDPRGRGIEAGDDKNRTPLNYATRMNLLPHTQLLIDYGADLEATGSKTKRTILLNALYWNSHLVLPVLLQHGARTDVTDAAGATVLHHITQFCSLETVQVLAKQDLGYINRNAVDSTGRTAVDVFNSEDVRCSPDKEKERSLAAEAFAAILAKASRPRSGTSSDFGLKLQNVFEIKEINVLEREEDSDDEKTLHDEKGVRKAEATEDGWFDADDDDDIFYDALQELPTDHVVI